MPKLTASQQEVIRLRFQSGLSYKEISGVTGMTVNHVGVVLHNALKTLREELQTAVA
jgi:RNA polymerase sigma-70 factor (ECF subfamily)